MILVRDRREASAYLMMLREIDADTGVRPAIRAAARALADALASQFITAVPPQETQVDAVAQGAGDAVSLQSSPADSRGGVLAE